MTVIAAIMRSSSPAEKQSTIAKKDGSSGARGGRVDTGYDEREATRETRNVGRERDSDDEGLTRGAMVAIVLAYIVFVVLLAVWVVKDCRNRSIENGIFWMLLIFPLNVLALIIYMAARPNGTLVRCEHCRNLRLTYVGVCPHCHCDVRQRGAGPD